MRAILKLESIADNYFAYKRHLKKGGRIIPAMEHFGETLGYNKKPCWVARLLSYDGLNFEREFINPQRDYTEANSTGSRGIYLYYPLKSGIYEINERVKWRRVKRWYARIENAEIIEIDKQEAIKCLPKNI